MRNPLAALIPCSHTHLLYLRILIVLNIIYLEGRFIIPKTLIKRRVTLLPNCISLVSRGLSPLAGRLLILIRVSLIPWSTISFHFPLLGIGIRISIWIAIFFVSLVYRSFQSKKEFLRDRSLGWGWVILSVGIESISRGARAITLGARIRVNIIIGGILHSVAGATNTRLALLVLCIFEILVVLIQVYVFILLRSLYSGELE